MDNQFAGEIAVVTGGAHGIGIAIAEVFKLVVRKKLPYWQITPLEELRALFANMALYLCSDKAGFITSETSESSSV